MEISAATADLDPAHGQSGSGMIHFKKAQCLAVQSDDPHGQAADTHIW
jgi:hypothetical protein